MATAAFSSSVLLPLMSMNKMCSSSSSSSRTNNNATSMISFSVTNISGSCRVSMSVSDHGANDTTPINADSPLKNLSPVARRRVDALRDIQDQYRIIEDEHYEEFSFIEAKYLKLYHTIYVKRFELMNSISEIPLPPDETDQVPNFWLAKLKDNEIISKEITKSDAKALKYLKNVKWCNIKGQLEFFFDSNPYFKNTVLTPKSRHVVNDEVKIDWYPGKCLTQKNKSFFNFFNPPQDYPYFDIELEIRHEIIQRVIVWYDNKVRQEEKALRNT